jgi:rhodanese-related sulfurtransferase
MAEAEAPSQEALAPERAAELARDGGAQLVDVRTGPEHEAGRIAGALHVPLTDLTEDASGLERDRPVLFYCRGGERSALAAGAFRASGWDAYSVDGGLVAWADAGLPLEPENGEVAVRPNLPGA